MESTGYYCHTSNKLEFLFNSIFSSNTQISNSTKIHPVGAELFHADRQTERHDEVNNRFLKILRTRLENRDDQTLRIKLGE